MSSITQVLQIATPILCNIIEYTHGSEQTTTTTQRPNNFGYNFGYVGPWPTIIQVLIGSTIVGSAFLGYKAYNSIDNNKRDINSTNNEIEMKVYDQVETAGGSLTEYHDIV